MSSRGFFQCPNRVQPPQSPNYGAAFAQPAQFLSKTSAEVAFSPVPAVTPVEKKKQRVGAAKPSSHATVDHLRKTSTHEIGRWKKPGTVKQNSKRVASKCIDRAFNVYDTVFPKRYIGELCKTCDFHVVHTCRMTDAEYRKYLHRTRVGIIAPGEQQTCTFCGFWFVHKTCLSDRGKSTLRVNLTKTVTCTGCENVWSFTISETNQCRPLQMEKCEGNILACSCPCGCVEFQHICKTIEILTTS